MEKWGDHQKKKSLINNSFIALILFKEEYQSLIETACSIYQTCTGWTDIRL